MEKRLLLLIPIAMGSYFMAAQESESDHYIFLSAKVNAKVNDEFHRIKSFDGKRLRLEGTKKQARASGSNPCTHIASVAVSKEYAEILDLNFDFGSDEALLRESDAVSDMVNMQTSYAMQINEVSFAKDADAANGADEDSGSQQAFERQISRLESISGGIQSVIKERANGEVIDGEFAQRIDVVQGSFSVIPQNDVENGYAVIVLSFDDESAKMRMQGVRTQITRTIPMGNLKAGSKNTIRFRNDFNERVARNPQFDVYLFTGKGMPIATSDSPGLRKLTVSQLQKFQKLQRLRAGRASQAQVSS